MQLCMPMRLPAPAVLPLTSVIIRHGAAEWLLQAAKTNMARCSGMSSEGTVPSNNLDGGKKTFVFAMVMLCVGLVLALLGSAVFFLWASWGVRHDIM